MPRRSWPFAVAAMLLATSRPSMQPPAPAQPAGEARVDYLTFARGAIPLRVTGSALQLGAGDEQALRVVDGSPTPFTVAAGARHDTAAEFSYELPALTAFDRFAVPDVIESPNPSITFVRLVEVLGSSTGPEAGYTLLASSVLTPHTRRGEVAELTVVESRPVRWIKLRLTGGIDFPRGEAAVEFTELVGNGSQDAPAPVYRFRGDWTGGGMTVALRQQGSAVSGCFSTGGELSGTVSGNVLHAMGVSRTDKVASLFVLAVGADGTLRGLRGGGKAPFRSYTAAKNVSGAPSRCTPPPVGLACGAVIHALFDQDSAAMPASASPILDALAGGLRSEPRSVVIEGHASPGDGADAAALSLRRAEAVVGELVRRGVAAERVHGTGVGGARPISGGTDDVARSFNRRLEVRCQ